MGFKNKTHFPKTFLNQTNEVYKFTCLFQECLLENDTKVKTYIGHTTTTLSRRLMHYLSDISAIKKHHKNDKPLQRY